MTENLAPLGSLYSTLGLVVRFRFLLGSTLVLTHPLWLEHKKATAYATRLRTAAAFIFLRVFARRLRLNTHRGSSPPGAFSFSSTKFLPTQTPRMLRCARLGKKKKRFGRPETGWQTQSAPCTRITLECILYRRNYSV